MAMGNPGVAPQRNERAPFLRFPVLLLGINWSCGSAPVPTAWLNHCCGRGGCGSVIAQAIHRDWEECEQRVGAEECVRVGVQPTGTGLGSVEEQRQQQNSVFPWLQQLPDCRVSGGCGGNSRMGS